MHYRMILETDQHGNLAALALRIVPPTPTHADAIIFYSECSDTIVHCTPSVHLDGMVRQMALQSTALLSNLALPSLLVCPCRFAYPSQGSWRIRQ